MNNSYKNFFLGRFGVMQGRLVNQERNKIQSFPWKNWKKEFKILKENKFNLLEWTVDSEKFTSNPINTNKGRKIVNDLFKYLSKNPKKHISGDLFKNANNEKRVVADFIAGMTDRYAINLHKKIKLTYF